MGRRIIAAAGIALVLFAGAACGGDDDGGGSPFGGGGGGGGDDAGDFDPGDIGDIPGLSDECEAVYNVIMAMTAAMVGGEEGGEYFDRARDAVPDELKDDVQVIADAYGPYMEKIASFGGDSQAAYDDPEVQAMAEHLQDPEVVQASENLNDYASDSGCS